MQTHTERIAWFAQNGYAVGPDLCAGILAAQSSPCTHIETEDRSGWLTHDTGLIMWHGSADQEFLDFVRECTEPPKPVVRRRTLFDVDNDKPAD